MKKIRILQIVYTLDACGGIENYVMNYYRNIDRNKIQFDFIIHKKTPENFIEEVKELGGNVYIFPEFSFKNLFSILNKIKQFLRTHNYKIILALLHVFIFIMLENIILNIEYYMHTNQR